MDTIVYYGISMGTNTQHGIREGSALSLVGAHMGTTRCLGPRLQLDMSLFSCFFFWGWDMGISVPSRRAAGFPRFSLPTMYLGSI